MPATSPPTAIDLADRAAVLTAILAKVQRALSWEDRERFDTIVETERQRIDLERARHNRPRLAGPLF